jgi:hypothetical protein
MANDVSTETKPGYLALHGTAYTLDLDECPAMMLQKQIAFEGTWSVTVDAQPKAGEEAGTVVWWSRGAYAAISLRGTDDGLCVCLKYSEPDSDDFTVSLSSSIKAGPC